MNQKYAQFWFSRKGSGNSFSTTLCVWFFKKFVSHIFFYWQNKFHCLIAFTSWDIGQYVYCNCLLGCDVINFEINLIFLIDSFLYMTKKSRQTLSLSPPTLLNKRLWHSCFHVNFAKFLRTLFYRTPLVAASVYLLDIYWWNSRCNSFTGQHSQFLFSPRCIFLRYVVLL